MYETQFGSLLFCIPVGVSCALYGTVSHMWETIGDPVSNLNRKMVFMIL